MEEGAGGRTPTQILTDELTLSQPKWVGGQIMATTLSLTPSPKEFQTFLQPCYVHQITNQSKEETGN